MTLGKLLKTFTCVFVNLFAVEFISMDSQLSVFAMQQLQKDMNNFNLLSTSSVEKKPLLFALFTFFILDL